MATDQDRDAVREAVMQVVRGHFRPEFLNRIDESVVFDPLGSKDIRAIAAIQTQSLAQRLKERDIAIEFSDAALDLIAQAGFDPVYGARPLKRALQTRVENPLSRELLTGAYAAGDTIMVDANDQQLEFSLKSRRAELAG